jgi:hypothetical protein
MREGGRLRRGGEVGPRDPTDEEISFRCVGPHGRETSRAILLALAIAADLARGAFRRHALVS